MIILLMCLTLGAPISACGIKPSDLAPPEGEETNFPHTYPAESTDPPPPLKPTNIDVEPMPTGSGDVVTY
ncbi:MAG: hypothetical protein DHS20C02_03730 [Micavibrio sp.]|nr:MAG: hypothetical protein DHS20C02_03730 [Micavibrio sp.]